MPCSCWYEPDDKVQRDIKRRCEELVAIVKKLEEWGDPGSCSLEGVVKLLRHLHDPASCDERPKPVPSKANGIENI